MLISKPLFNEWKFETFDDQITRKMEAFHDERDAGRDSPGEGMKRFDVKGEKCKRI